MKEQSPKEKSPLEKYKERQQWARELAKRFHVEVDERAEFFIVPIHDENGKEIRKKFIPARGEIPLADEKGNKADTISAEDAIEATQKYPGETLRAAKQKLTQERGQQPKHN